MSPKYKDGKQLVQLEFKEFREAMENRKNFVKPLRDRAWLSLLYWTGVRKIEALNTRKEDYKVQDEILIINAPPVKGGFRLELEINVNLPYVDLIIQLVNRTKKGKRVFKMNPWTGWKIIKRVFPKKYPHFFRLNRATRFLDDPDTSTTEMLSWFGWRSIRTIDRYIGYSKRGVKRQSKRLSKEVSE